LLGKIHHFIFTVASHQRLAVPGSTDSLEHYANYGKSQGKIH
jgi:hypothetical protein